MVIMSFNLVLLWKLDFLWKIAKWYELRWILGLIGIGQWYVYVYVNALICELCVYLVEAIELGYFGFGELIKKS